jgi:hypothetical protein
VRGGDNYLWQAYRYGNSWAWWRMDTTQTLTGSPAAMTRI